MQKFILITLALGLGFFLYLLQTGEISSEDFSIKRLQGETEFIIKKSEEEIHKDSKVKYSDIFTVVKGREYKVFSFSGDSFKKLIKAEYSLEKYRVPLEAVDAVSGTWIGNRYVFYILQKDNPETGKKTYEIYKTEYSTDDVGKLEYSKIKSIEEYEVDNTFEVRY
jgi:hypothetical protein